jgi:hypothetical protein
MAYSTMRSAISLSSVSGGTFTAKLQNACTSTLYPEGTVFDCSGFTSVSVPSQAITGTITITRAGITLLFSEGDFIMSTAGDANMFDIQAPNVTIIGVSRSAKDSVPTNGATRFVMNSPSTGYHVYTRPNLTTFASSDSLTIMNCDFVGVKSIYTSSGGTVNYSTTGAGGIVLTEGNVDQPNSNLNNVMISEVLVSGAKQHGIMIYGGMASKLQNVRVRNAAGHGFYIAGSTTSTSLDACYASGNYLAGFCINNTTYSTLTSCASDSNGLGYWMRNANSVTLNSCGAEACEVRSSIPNNLGITVKNSAGNVLINDIGSDNVNFIKGSSFLFTGGSNITGTSCYSKDPGNRAGQSTFVSKYTAHIHAEQDTEKVNMDNFLATGTSPTKYLYRLGNVSKFQIDDDITTFDPSNPSETADGAMVPIANVLDAGDGNVFGDFERLYSFGRIRTNIVDPNENFMVDQLAVNTRLSIPTYNAHPANPQAGTIYFNTALNKLYMYSGSAWFDTCCGTAPTPAPDCVFPNGGITDVTSGIYPTNIVRLGNKVYMLNANANGSLGVFDIATEQFTIILNKDNLPRLAPDRNFVVSIGLSYTPINNCLYFAYGEVTGGDESNIESYLGNAEHIVKYDITANTTLVKSIVQDDIPTYEDATTAFSRYQFYVHDGLLYGIANSFGPYVSDPRNLRIIKHDLETLDYINHLEGPDMSNEPTFASYGTGVDCASNDEFRSKFAEQTGSMLIKPSRYLAGEVPYLYQVNFADASYTKRYFGTEEIPSLDGVTNYVSGFLSITPSQENTYFITNSLEGKFWEMEYDNFTPLLQRTIGNCGDIVERNVNANRLLFYRKNSWSDVTTSLTSYFSCYNLTTDEFLGDIAAATYSGQPYYPTSISTSFFFGPALDGGPSYPFIYSSGGNPTKVIKFCAPYAI